MKRQELDIRGEVGALGAKHGLSPPVILEIYEMFCGQARRWESKVHACAARIRQQRAEIKRLRVLQ